VISSKRCPHTGVVNFFIAADPLLAVGSINQTAAKGPAGAARFAWHCYLDEETAGMAPDIKIAEANLKRAIASRREVEVV